MYERIYSQRSAKILMSKVQQILLTLYVPTGGPCAIVTIPSLAGMFVFVKIAECVVFLYL